MVPDLNWDGKGCAINIRGPIVDVFAALIIFLLHESPGIPILRCPECATIFYRIRKQQYCSCQCVNRVNARKWRASPEGKKKQATRSRKRYQKQVRRAKENNNLKVGRGLRNAETES